MVRGRVLVFGRGDDPINFVSVRDVGKLVDARYPDLPLTSPSDVIARIAREKDQRPH